jgi:class 3 adenylate cyclase/tetratricopeptide (TPR) repeat protein
MIYVFGAYELDEDLYEMRRGGVPAKLEPQVFKVLTYLIQHRDRVVTKDELLAKLWPGEFVTESALARCIVQARQAVRDSGVTQRVIKTIHRHGYRFVAAVETRTQVAAADAPSAVRSPTGEAAALLAPSPMPQADTSGAGHLSRTGERKQITVLAAGVRGLTALAQGHDPEAWHEMLTRLFDVLRAEVQRVEGLVSQVTGEELIALFGAPIAQEDHAVRALHAALGMQRAFAALAAELPGSQAGSLALRLGMHSGPVLVTAMGDDERLHYAAEGFAVHLARRLQEHAADGTIYVSEAVRQQAAGFFHFDDLGAFTLPEVAQPVRVYTCTLVERASSRLEAFLQRHTSMFLGREREMELLDTLWSRVRRGQGQVVCLVGEAGVGKSRLAYEFQRTLIDARTLQAQTLSYGQSVPYHPLIPLLRALLDLHAQDPPTDQRQQIRAHLHALHPTLAEDEPLLSHLLGVPLESDRLPDLSPDERKRRLQQLCLRLLVPQGTETPLCLLVEDLHWLDPSSHELLDLLVPTLARLPVLLLGTARPGFRHTWDDLTYFHRLTVDPLADDHIDALIRDYFQPYDASPALAVLIRQRTGGNPFFLEELLRTLHDQQLIVRQDDTYILNADAHLDLPSSIHGILAARIDQLSPIAKQLLQTAAVIGTEVPFALLQALVELPEADLRGALAHLRAAEFLYETRLFPEHVYTFKHALTHEVAYGSLLLERRRMLHARLVEALETLMGDRLDDQVERLAHHALWGEVWPKALAYGLQAGDKARARSAYREAVASYEQALVALQHLPDNRAVTEQAIDIRLRLRSALNPLGATPEQMLDHLRHAETLAQALGDSTRLGRVYPDMSVNFRMAGDIDRAIEYGQRALAVAARLGDVGIQARAHLSLSYAYYDVGDYARAIEHLGWNVMTLQGDLLTERFGLPCSVAAFSGGWLSLCHAERGAFTEGLAVAEDALRIAETVNDPMSQIMARYGVSVVLLRQGQVQRAIPVLEPAMELCQDRHIPLFLPRLAAALGLAYVLDGRVAAGLALVEHGVEQEAARGRQGSLTPLVACLSEAYLLAGRLGDVHTRAAQALELARQYQQRGNQAWALWLLGESTARRAPSGVAPTTGHYRQALALADDLGMRPLLAHCHLGLGILYARLGRRKQARAELSAAIELYRTMKMVFWLTHAEAVLVQTA